MGRLGVAAIFVGATVVLAQTQPADAQVRLGRPNLPPAPVEASKPTPPVRPAPRPDMPPPQLPPNVLGGSSRDVFRARPDTYRPDRHRLLVPTPYYGPLYYEPYGVPYAPYELPVTPPPPAPVQQPPAASTLPAQTSSPGIAPVARPPHSGPLYVIPQCYAGDRPPRADQLRPGCNV